MEFVVVYVLKLVDISWRQYGDIGVGSYYCENRVSMLGREVVSELNGLYTI